MACTLSELEEPRKQNKDIRCLRFFKGPLRLLPVKTVYKGTRSEAKRTVRRQLQ